MNLTFPGGIGIWMMGFTALSQRCIGLATPILMVENIKVFRFF